MAEERIMKRVEDSRTIQTHLVLTQHLNQGSTLFGGQLLSWLDMLAGIVALRHSNHNVVTVAVDRIAFEQSAEITDIITMIGEVTYVGNSSMEIRIESFKENRGGEKTRINEAYFVMVAVDDETKRPTPVPGLILETEEQKREFEAGRMRAILRSARKKASKERQPS